MRTERRLLFALTHVHPKNLFITERLALQPFPDHLAQVGNASAAVAAELDAIRAATGDHDLDRTRDCHFLVSGLPFLSVKTGELYTTESAGPGRSPPAHGMAGG
jgi:hypothetical protein